MRTYYIFKMCDRNTSKVKRSIKLYFAMISKNSKSDAR